MTSPRPAAVSPRESWFSGVKTRYSTPAILGLLALIVGVGGFGFWAFTAPMQGAIIAPGVVTVAGRNKLVQHLEGGIVKNMHVREGDQVTLDMPLVTLDATAPAGIVNRIKSQILSQEATEIRLIAERDGLEELVFPEKFLVQAADDIKKLKTDQEQEFKTRLSRHKTELGIIGQKSAALSEEIAGLEAQRKASNSQIELVRAEKVDSEGLLAKGLIQRRRVMELQRLEAETEGQIGRAIASIGGLRQEIAQNGLEALRLGEARREAASNQLSEVRLQQADFSERQRTAMNELDRTRVRAPASGRIIKLKDLNPGSVISPGQVLMEIVPDTTALIIDARIRTQDIDNIKIGQEAMLHFQAFAAKRSPPLPGHVILVSADRITDERNGESYYLARLSMSAEPVAGFDPTRVGAGQPVDVFITTGNRTFSDYALAPFWHSFDRAMREQ